LPLIDVRATPIRLDYVGNKPLIDTHEIDRVRPTSANFLVHRFGRARAITTPVHNDHPQLEPKERLVTNDCPVNAMCVALKGREPPTCAVAWPDRSSWLT
jgi:hypothetical protein